jgi:hypothetical protein
LGHEQDISFLIRHFDFHVRSRDGAGRGRSGSGRGACESDRRGDRNRYAGVAGFAHICTGDGDFAFREFAQFSESNHAHGAGHADGPESPDQPEQSHCWRCERQSDSGESGKSDFDAGQYRDEFGAVDGPWLLRALVFGAVCGQN